MRGACRAWCGCMASARRSCIAFVIGPTPFYQSRVHPPIPAGAAGGGRRTAHAGVQERGEQEPHRGVPRAADAHPGDPAAGLSCCYHVYVVSGHQYIHIRGLVQQVSASYKLLLFRDFRCCAAMMSASTMRRSASSATSCTPHSTLRRPCCRCGTVHPASR